MDVINITEKMLMNGLEDGEYYQDGQIITNNYDVKSMCLVRTTNIFPSDGCIRSMANSNTLLKTSSMLLGEALNNTDLKDKCQIMYHGYRSTVHFSMNGLVSNHAYGNFSNRNFIIIEPFFHHIQDDIISLRVEDTYFKDFVSLSDEACVILSKDKLEEIKNNAAYQDFLFSHKLFVYNFKEEEKKKLFSNNSLELENYNSFFEQRLVNCVLENLGYPHFNIGSNGYVDNNKSVDYMNSFVEEFRKKMKIGNERHFNSELHMLDSKQNSLNLKTSDINYYRYIVINSGINNEQLLSYIKYFEYNGNYDSFKYSNLLFDEDGNIIMKEEILEKIKEFINRIGIQKLLYLTEEYNNLYMMQEQKIKR